MRRSSIQCLAAMALVLNTTTAVAQAKGGVSVCDDFFTKFDACMTKMPPERQAQFGASINQLRSAMQQQNSPQAQSTFEGVCKQLRDGIRQATAPLACVW